MPAPDASWAGLLGSERLDDGEVVARYRLQAGPLRLEFMTLGAAIVRLDVPDRHGRAGNVVLDHARLARYFEGREYFGAIVGRLANRLRAGLLLIDGVTHRLTANDGAHHLHGGTRGFDKRSWSVVELATGAGWAEATLQRVSAAGEEGYPGELHVRVRYRLSNGGVVDLQVDATTDAPTVVNLTNHSYFNLRGAGDILGHELQLEADRFCVVDRDLLPTGELRSVAGTPFDFREPKRVGRDIDADVPQLQLAGGYDHCMVLMQPAGAATGTDPASSRLRRAAVLADPDTGRRVEVWTDQPSVQLYSGNFLDGTGATSDGRPLIRRAGLCLETQHLPDAPHHAAFPSVVLRPGATYRTVTQWRFGV